MIRIAHISASSISRGTYGATRWTFSMRRADSGVPRTSTAGPVIRSSTFVSRRRTWNAYPVHSSHSPFVESPTPLRASRASAFRINLDGGLCAPRKGAAEACQTGPPKPSSIHSYPLLTDKIMLACIPFAGCANCGIAVSQASRQCCDSAVLCGSFIAFWPFVFSLSSLVSDGSLELCPLFDPKPLAAFSSWLTSFVVLREATRPSVKST